MSSEDNGAPHDWADKPVPRDWSKETCPLDGTPMIGPGQCEWSVEYEAAYEAKHGRSWIGLHGPIHNPTCDPNGRAVYCVDECICAHCAEISQKLWRAETKAGTLYACVVVMFFLGLMLGVFGYVIGHGPL